MLFKIFFYTVVKYYKSLAMFSVILAPFSLLVEWSLAKTLLQSSNYGFTVLFLSVLFNGGMYIIKCWGYKRFPTFESFLSGGIRLCFYAILLMTAYNYELNMIQIYGEEAANDMIVSKLIRHVLLNMMIVYELEMANKNYRQLFKKNLPIIGLIVKVRNMIQKKIIFKLNQTDVCPPLSEDKKEEI